MLTESFLEDCGGGVVRVSSGLSSIPLESTRGIPCLVFLSTSFIPTVTLLWVTQHLIEKRERETRGPTHSSRETLSNVTHLAAATQVL